MRVGFGGTNIKGVGPSRRLFFLRKIYNKRPVWIGFSGAAGVGVVHNVEKKKISP